MATDERELLRKKLVTYLQDAYAMENHLVDVLEKQVDETADVPTFQMRISRHLEETKEHRNRIESCLQRYNEKPSGIKSALTNMSGSLQGLMSGKRPDALAMSSRDSYVAENFEIASYGLLIATAQSFGDQETVQACQANLRDEVMMAKWLEYHTAQAALLSLEKDGISFTPSVVEQEQTQMNSSMRQLWQEAEQLAGASAG
jgi:ferritin-like metal-binding protein YciE